MLQIRINHVKEATEWDKGCARKDKPPSDDEEEEEEEEGEEETIPKQGKASSVAEALADTQAKSEAQSAIPSAGKESGKESLRADTANLQSDGALNAVIKRRSEDAQRLKDENADLKRQLEALEEKQKSSQVRKSTISKCQFE